MLIILQPKQQKNLKMLSLHFKGLPKYVDLGLSKWQSRTNFSDRKSVFIICKQNGPRSACSWVSSLTRDC